MKIPDKKLNTEHTTNITELYLISYVHFTINRPILEHFCVPVAVDLVSVDTCAFPYFSIEH